MARPASVSLHFTSELPAQEALRSFAGHEVCVFGRLARLEVKTSTSQDAYRAHPFSPPPPSLPLPPRQPVPFSGTSTTHSDFVHHNVGRPETSPRPPPRQPVPFFSGVSSYKEDFTAKILPPSPPLASPPPRPAVPFDGCSTTHDTFRGHAIQPNRPSLGVATMGDRYQVLIHGSAPAPTSGGQVFTTVHDGQEWVCFLVYQGDAPLASSNQLLGQFQLGPLPRAPAGSLKIQVTFYLDQDGEVSASAVDMVSERQYQWKLQRQ